MSKLSLVNRLATGVTGLAALTSFMGCGGLPAVPDSTIDPGGVGGSTVDGDGAAEDPSTPSGACLGLGVGDFYNDEYRYGFELPLLSDLDAFDNSPTFLFNADWTVTVGAADFGLYTLVMDLPEVGLTDDEEVLDVFVSELNADDPDRPQLILSQDRITLADGRVAYLTIGVFGETTGVTSYGLLTVKDNLLYRVAAAIADTELDVNTEAIILNILLSTCLE